MVVLVNQLWVSSDPIRTKKSPAHRREASAALALALASVLRLSPLSKKAWPILCSLFLLPRSNSPRLGLVRNAFARGTSAHHSPLFQPPTSSSVHSTSLDRLSISHSVAEPSLTHPIRRANNIIVPRHYPPVETLASAAAAGTIGLLETPQSPTSLQTISQSPSTSARDNP